jgi:hypothetical protein
MFLLSFKLKYLIAILPLILTQVIFTKSYSQENKEDLNIVLVSKFGEEHILKDTWYITETKDSIQISKIKFYLTDFKIESKRGMGQSINNSTHLIDVFDKNTLNIVLPNVDISTCNEVLFNIGVEEEMNTSGALSGDLDPSKGMYWSWQSGYINFKFEGKSPSCETRKNKFQFHIGGYQKPFTTTRPVTIEAKSIKNNTLTVVLDVSKLFKSINLKSTNQVIIPGKKASDLAEILPTLFSVDD